MPLPKGLSITKFAPWRFSSLRTYSIAVALTAALATPTYAASFQCSGTAISPYPALVSNDHDHRRMAPEFHSTLWKPFTAYFAVFDDADDDTGDGLSDARMNPEFVAYELRGVAPDANGDYPEPDVSITRPGKWYTSPDLVPLVESLPNVTNERIDNAYAGVGDVWNRGHLAMSEHAQRISPEAACNTHHFWNASPQAAELNQGPWLHLENYSAAASNKYRSVWIVDGPIFDPSTPHLTIGDPGEVPVEIPDAFFKIIINESPLGISTLAFIFEQPNAIINGVARPTRSWIKCSTAAATPGWDYDHRPELVSIDQIEARTGLRFFPDRTDRQALVSAKAQRLWPVEERYWAPGNGTCGKQRGNP